MEIFLQFLLIGLGTGGLYALLAAGVVVTYRGSGIVNFANGAFALVGAAAYYQSVPIVPTPVAVLIGVAAAAIAGLAVHLLVIRPMRNSSPLARVIATLGLLTVAQQAASLHYSDTAIFVNGFLPSNAVHVFGSIIVPSDQMILLGMTVVLFAALWVVYARTRFGLATTGVAENEVAMSSLGWSPDLVAAVNWTLGAAIAGLAGILLVPITGLSPTSLTLTIIPALSAALVGGFSSLPLTLFGGLMVGVLESEATRYVTAPGWASAVPYIVIIFILVVRGRGLPLRSYLTDRLPRVGTGRAPLWVTALVVAIAVITTLVGSVSWTDAMITTAVVGIICLSLVVLTGYCGQLSLAQYSIAGVGALVSSRLADAAHLTFVLSAIIGVAATVLLALITGLPSLRARGVNLAVATMGLSVVISAVIFANPNYTGGLISGTVVPPPKLFGWDVYVGDHPARYTLLCLIALALVCLGVANLRRGRSGRAMIAVRDNERAAASLGISVFTAKLYAFSLAGAIAGVGGVLLAFQTPNVTFDQYDVFHSIGVVLFTAIGGLGYIGGGIVGGLADSGSLIQELLAKVVDVGGWFPLAAACLLIVTIIRAPDGVVHAFLEWTTPARGWLRAKSAGLMTFGRGRTPESQSVLSEFDAAGERVPPREFVLRDVSMRFGGIVALDRVTLSVSPGEVVGLIGPNGAGKTTIIDVASGFHRSHSGSVELAGKPLTRASASARSRRGLTRSFQSLELFDDLDVLGNLRTASDDRSLALWLLELVRPQRRVRLNAVASAACREFGLMDVLGQRPTELPYATRRLVAIARAVATRPSVLLLDEPAAGLDEASTRELGVLIKRLARDWGIGVLLVEHDVPMVLATCDRVVALNFGKVIGTGTPEEIKVNEAVVAAYLGAAVDEHDPGESPVPMPVPTVASPGATDSANGADR